VEIKKRSIYLFFYLVVDEQGERVAETSNEVPLASGRRWSWGEGMLCESLSDWRMSEQKKVLKNRDHADWLRVSCKKTTGPEQ